MRSAASSAYGQSSRWVCCSSFSARTFTTADPASARANRICSRCSRLVGTFAWAAKIRSVRSSSSSAAGEGARKKGSDARPKAMCGAISAPIARNSAISRWLCRMNRSQALRNFTARRVAGTLMPGRPVTRTGRLRPLNSRVAAKVATTGPVQASSTTSGFSARNRRTMPARSRTWTGSTLAVRICPSDGITGFSMTTCDGCQLDGSAASVAELHLRYESVSAIASTRFGVSSLEGGPLTVCSAPPKALPEEPRASSAGHCHTPSIALSPKSGLRAVPLESVHFAVGGQVGDEELTRDQRGRGHVERVEDVGQHRSMHADCGWLARRQYRSTQLCDQFGDGRRIIPTNLFGELAELVDREPPSFRV